MAIVKTDKLDYAPGETAIITTVGFTPGYTIEFHIEHVTDPGDDGVFGTLDDVLDAGVDGEVGTEDDGTGTTGEGHDPFYVTDGVYEIVDLGADGLLGTADDVIIGDQDMTANGTIVTEWYVNPDDSLNETFLLTAEEVQAGDDGLFGTADDVYTGEVATTSFTDEPIANRLQDHKVWEIPNGNYTPGNVSGYREGDSASFVVTTAFTAADFQDADNDGILDPLTVDFNIWLSLSVDNDPTTFAFADLGNYDDTVTPPIPNNVVTDANYTVYEDLGITGGGGTGNGSVTVLQADDGSDSVDLLSLTYQGADFGSSTNFQLWNVTFEVSDPGTYFFLYGGVLAAPGDVVPAVGGGTTIAEFGAASVSGVFDARIQSDGTGDKTVPFKGDLIIIEPDIWVTKEIDRDDDGEYESLANVDEYSFTAYLDDGDGIIEIGVGGDDTATTYTLLTDTNGQVRFENVGDGTYWITETQVDFTEGTYEFGNILINYSGTPSGVFGEVAQVTVAEGTSKNVQEADVTFQNIPLQFVRIASYTIDKVVTDVDGAGPTGVVDSAGDVISYQIAVENTGNTFLNDVVVTDQVEGGTVDTLTLESGDADSDGFLDADETIEGVDTDSDGKLDSAETWIYNDTYTVQQSDLDNNGGGDSDIDNTATATVSSPELPTQTATASVPITQDPSIDVVKTNEGVVDLDGNGDDAGDQIVYDYTVTNDGNVTLTDVTLNDDQLGGITLTGLTDEDSDGTADDLAVGASATGTATATLTQDQIDAGSVTNIALGTGTDPNDVDTTDTDSNTVPIDQNPSIQIDKKTNGSDGLTILTGKAITWTYDVTNVGNVTLDNVVVDDDMLSDDPLYVSGDDGNGLLDVGETWFYQATGTAVADLYENTGSVDALGPQDQPTSDSDDSSYYGANPLIDVEKLVFDTYAGEYLDADTAPGALVAEGNDPLFLFEVSNTGNVDFDDFTLTDNQGLIPIYDRGDTDNDGNLDVHETWIYEATGTWAEGQQTNTATVTGSYTDDLGNLAEPSDTDDAYYFGIPNPQNLRSLSVDLPRDANDGIKNGVFLHDDGEGDGDLDFHGWASLTNESNDGNTPEDPDVSEYVTTLSWSFQEDLNPAKNKELWSTIPHQEEDVINGDLIDNYTLETLWIDADANGIYDVGEEKLDFTEVINDSADGLSPDYDVLTIDTFIEVEDTVNLGFEFDFVDDAPDPMRVTLTAVDFQGRDFHDTEVYDDFDVLLDVLI